MAPDPATSAPPASTAILPDVRTRFSPPLPVSDRTELTPTVPVSANNTVPCAPGAVELARSAPRSEASAAVFAMITVAPELVICAFSVGANLVRVTENAELPVTATVPFSDRDVTEIAPRVVSNVTVPTDGPAEGSRRREQGQVGRKRNRINCEPTERGRLELIDRWTSEGGALLERQPTTPEDARTGKNGHTLTERDHSRTGYVE